MASPVSTPPNCHFLQRLTWDAHPLTNGSHRTCTYITVGRDFVVASMDAAEPISSVQSLWDERPRIDNACIDQVTEVATGQIVGNRP